MRQIRTGVFETNSSSVHSICIAKEKTIPDKSITFMIGDYGWEIDTVNVPDYLYTGILLQDDYKELLAKLKRMLNRMNISYKFQTPMWDSYSNGEMYLDNGRIDHSEDVREFIDAVLNDDNMLMRALFHPDSVVYTGNDNTSWDDRTFRTYYVADETYWDDNKHEYVPNPHHDKEKFDYFRKSN